jgi:hypothetical protein
MTATDHRMTRRSLFVGAAASVASIMPVRGLPLQLLNPERKIPRTVGEWYRLSFYNSTMT